MAQIAEVRGVKGYVLYVIMTQCIRKSICDSLLSTFTWAYIFMQDCILHNTAEWLFLDLNYGESQLTPLML